MKRTYLTTMLLACLAAVPAHADNVTDAKMQCQIEYGTGSDLGVACQQGVRLAPGLPAEEAMRACFKLSEDAAKVVACRRGVALHSRVTSRKRGDDASFSYTWAPKRGAAHVDIGNYRAIIGDAEKSMDDCLRASEGSSTPPSCLSGFTAQRRPPE